MVRFWLWCQEGKHREERTQIWTGSRNSAIQPMCFADGTFHYQQSGQLCTHSFPSRTLSNLFIKLYNLHTVWESLQPISWIKVLTISHMKNHTELLCGVQLIPHLDLGIWFTMPSTHPTPTTLTIQLCSHRSQIPGGTIVTKNVKYIKHATSRGGPH